MLDTILRIVTGVYMIVLTYFAWTMFLKNKLYENKIITTYDYIANLIIGIIHLLILAQIMEVL